MTLISVIIPVYNVEKYLGTCIDSVINQTYRNIEIILVDDGSTDNSGKICDEYKKRDSRIRVIHKNNGGLSDARNAGLDIAAGEYVSFIDSDDYYYDSTCVADIMNVIAETNPDIVLIPTIIYFDEKNNYVYKDKHYHREILKDSTKSKAIEYLLKYDAFKACACDKVVRRSIVEKNKIRFKKGVLSEDIDWTAEILKHSEKYDCLERPVYVYRQRSGSITKTPSMKHVDDIFEQIIKWDIYAAENSDNLMYGYLAHNYVMLLEYFGKIKGWKKNKLMIKKIKKYSYLLKYDYSLNVSKVKKMYFITGPYIVIFALQYRRR